MKKWHKASEDEKDEMLREARERSIEYQMQISTIDEVKK
jgi:predicted Fe-S protein YdhL (DUF1289 family)